MPERSSFPYRAYYFSIYAGLGLTSTYLNLYYKRAGLGNEQLGWLHSCQSLLGIVGPPLWGVLADRMGSQRKPGLFLMGVTAALVPLLFLKREFAWLFVIALFIGFFGSGIVPLADAGTIAHVKRTGADYGHIRVWGSIGFVAAINLIAPLLPDRAHADADALRPVFIAFVLWRLAGIFWGSKVPDGAGHRGPLWTGLKEAAALFRQRHIAWFTLCAFLGWGAMQAHYIFFTIYLGTLNVSDQWKGPFNSIGVVSEVLFLAVVGRFQRRLGPYGLMTAALGAAALRLSIYAMRAPLWVIAMAQALHALTFGAYHIASISFLQEHIPDRLRAGGQTLFSAVAAGLGGAVGAWFAGTMARRLHSLSGMFSAAAAVEAVAFLLALTLLLVSRQKGDRLDSLA